MIRVGLTGGIASGKTTVANLFAALGAQLIDWDVLAREVVAPGSSGLAEVVARFGSAVLDADGALNRARLAEIVFNDVRARRALNGITHPRIRELAWQLDGKSDSCVVLHVVPLLIEGRLQPDFDKIIVVDSSPDTQMTRLMSRDGLSEAEAAVRVRSQAGRQARLAWADYVIDNSSKLADAERQVQDLWPKILDAGKCD